MQDLFIGVDGGGTKTAALIQDASGHSLGMGIAGPGNIATSVVQSWESIQQAIDQASVAANINLQNFNLHVGLALAGTESNMAINEFLSMPHPFKTLVLKSDAHAACLGYHAGQDGAIIIIGTGIVGYQISKNKIYRISGYGFPHADEGSGAWLGLELFHLVFKAIDQRIAWTPMLSHTFAQFQNDLPAFINFAHHAQPMHYAKFARTIFAFKDEDALAHNLLARSGIEVDLIFTALIKQSGLKSFPLGLVGGLSSRIKEFTSNALQAQLVPGKLDIPHGAIMMVKQHLGWPA
jgi:glucosamine kinase